MPPPGCHFDPEWTTACCFAASVSATATAAEFSHLSPAESGLLMPPESGFSLSGGSDPTKDVILRLEAESNAETKVRQLPSCGKLSNRNAHPPCLAELQSSTERFGRLCFPCRAMRMPAHDCRR